MRAKHWKAMLGSKAALLFLAAGLFSQRGDLLAAWALSCIGFFALGVASFQVVDRQFMGTPPRRISLRDKDGNEKPRPVKAGLG